MFWREVKDKYHEEMKKPSKEILDTMHSTANFNFMFIFLLLLSHKLILMDSRMSYIL